MRHFPLSLVLLTAIPHLSGQSSQSHNADTLAYEGVVGRENAYSPDSVFSVRLASKEAMARTGDPHGVLTLSCQVPRDTADRTIWYAQVFPIRAPALATHPSAIRHELLKASFRFDGDTMHPTLGIYGEGGTSSPPYITYAFTYFEYLDLISAMQPGKTIRFFFDTPSGDIHYISWTSRNRDVPPALFELAKRCTFAFGRGPQ